MITIALSLTVIMAALAVGQFLPSLGFAWMLCRSKTASLKDEDCPKAVVILCLRGTDPFLSDCLEGLCNQDYSKYEIRIVIDHHEDPAWEVVEEGIERHQGAKITVEELINRFDTCALKGSSIIQVVSTLDDSFKIVAFLDGDTIPHPTWLRELAAPLLEDQIGVSSGNRWYKPMNQNLGSMVRYIWNAGAVVQMYWNRFTWGGSVALKARIARHPDMLESWRTSLSTDTVIPDVVRRLGLQVAFVPSLLMINRESCTIPRFFPWLSRQMTVGRLYHRRWKVILTHGILMTLIPIIGIIVLIGTLMNAKWFAALWLFAALIGYAVAMFMLLLILEMAVSQVVQDREESRKWLTFGRAVKVLSALPLTQLIYAAALTRALFMRTVTWRGVSYRINEARKVRLMEYRPYQSDLPSDDSIASR